MTFKKGNASWLGKKRPDLSIRMQGENNPAKRPEVREKLRKVYIDRMTKTGHNLSIETRRKIGDSSRGENLGTKIWHSCCY